MSPRLAFAVEDLIRYTLSDLKGTHWSFVIGVMAAAYLANFYAGVYLVLSQPPSLIVFIGEAALGG